MKLSIKGLDIIKKSEGLRLRAYPDPGSANGYPYTIGYGHTKGVKKGDSITKAQAEELLRQDVAWAVETVNSLGVKLTQNQFDALVSFCFNVGRDGFLKSSVARVVKAGRHDLVPSKLALWIKNDGKVMQGLINRRGMEARLYMSMDNKDIAAAPSAPVPGKPMKKSKTAWVAIGQALSALSMIFAYATEIKNNLMLLFEGAPNVNMAWVYGGVILVAVVFSAVWFFHDRHIKSVEDGV